MQNIFDSHAHYDSAAFQPDRDAALAALPEAGVVGVLNAGCDIETSHRALAIARKYDFIWAAAGVHPEFAGEAAEDSERGWLCELEMLLAEEKVVAVGEIGLDYHYDDAPPRKTQLEIFELQLALAKQHGLPVVIHSRDATEDMMKILRLHQPRGVLHCFSGSAETLREAVALGLYIGFTGVVTFPNARRAKECAAAVPLDRLLLETDCPYMAPVPLRGRRSDSAMISYTAAAIAEVRGITPQAVADAARENVRALYGV